MKRIKFDRVKLWIEGIELWIAFRVPVEFRQPARAFAKEMKPDKLHVAEIRLFREKRSSDANAYFWKLCGELAAAIGIPQDTIYIEYVKNIGDNFEIIPIKDKAVDRWTKNWQSRGAGWPCISLGPSKLAGYTNMVCYYGSSTYDTAQMSRLIDLLVYDCEINGIETSTPDEIARMKAEWGHAPDDKSV